MQKYPALRTYATVVKVLAWIVLVLGVLGSILVAVLTGVSGEEYAGVATIIVLIGGLLGTAIYFLILLAAAEFIRLAIDVEQNTRDTAESLKQRD